MFKNIKGFIKFVFVYCCPIFIILALFLHLRNIENFSFVVWFSQLETLIENPIQPLIDFGDYINRQIVPTSTGIGGLDKLVTTLQYLAIIAKSFVPLVYSILRAINILLNDVFVFLNWLTLGYYNSSELVSLSYKGASGFISVLP